MHKLEPRPYPSHLHYCPTAEDCALLVWRRGSGFKTSPQSHTVYNPAGKQTLSVICFQYTPCGTSCTTDVYNYTAVCKSILNTCTHYLKCNTSTHQILDYCVWSVKVMSRLIKRSTTCTASVGLWSSFQPKLHKTECMQDTGHHCQYN